MPKRIFKGVVIKNQNDKTIVVKVVKQKKDKLYKKYVTLYQKFTAHDPENKCKINDVVSIIESRPISKTKKWVLHEIHQAH